MHFTKLYPIAGTAFIALQKIVLPAKAALYTPQTAQACSLLYSSFSDGGILGSGLFENTSHYCEITVVLNDCSKITSNYKVDSKKECDDLHAQICEGGSSWWPASWGSTAGSAGNDASTLCKPVIRNLQHAEADIKCAIEGCPVKDNPYIDGIYECPGFARDQRCWMQDQHGIGGYALSFCLYRMGDKEQEELATALGCHDCHQINAFPSSDGKYCAYSTYTNQQIVCWPQTAGAPNPPAYAMTEIARDIRPNCIHPNLTPTIKEPSTTTAPVAPGNEYPLPGIGIVPGF
jgi:hypothetical protein